MPSAKKSKSKSRNTSTHKTKCRFCRAKCVGQNVCKNCRDTNCHYKLELLDDAIQKGEINEGEYLRQCKHLKEIKELEELAKGITTFDTPDIPTYTERVNNREELEASIARIQERIPEGGRVIRVPREISSAGMGAVVRYAEQLEEETTAMDHLMDNLAPPMSQRIFNLQQAGDVCRSVADTIISRLRGIFTFSEYGNPTEWHNFLRDAYNRNINENLVRIGFPRTCNENVEFSFEWSREGNGLKCIIKAVLENEDNYQTTTMAHLLWSEGGHFGRSNFRNYL